MNNELLKTSIQGNMLELTNNELVEYVPTSMEYQQALESLERLMGLYLVLENLEDVEIEIEDTNPFAEIERLLREDVDKDES